MLEKFKSGEVDIPSSSIPDLTALRRLILRGVAHVGNYDVPGYVRKYVRAGWGCVEEQESVSLITHHGISNGADHLGRLSGGEGRAGSHTVLGVICFHADCAFPAEGSDCEPIMGGLLRRDRSDGGGCRRPSTTLSWFAPRLDDVVPFGYYPQDMEATITTLLALQVSTNASHSAQPLGGSGEPPFDFGRKPIGARLTRGTSCSRQAESVRRGTARPEQVSVLSTPTPSRRSLAVLDPKIRAIGWLSLLPELATVADPQIEFRDDYCP